MTKIDVREAEPGPELDAACAEAMGWAQRMWDSLPGAWWQLPTGQVTQTVASWQPSTDISVAWELDSPSWHWNFEEADFYPEGKEVHCLVAWIRGENLPAGFSYTDFIHVRVPFSRFETKAKAYAYARSVIFLLAHGVTEIEVSNEAV